MTFLKNKDPIISLVSEKPRTYEQIAEITGENTRQVGQHINCLKKRGIPIRTTQLELRCSGYSDESGTVSLLKIAGQTIAYFDHQLIEVGDLIGMNIAKHLTQYEKTSLSRRLKNFIPEESIKRVKEYY